MLTYVNTIVDILVFLAKLALSEWGGLKISLMYLMIWQPTFHLLLFKKYILLKLGKFKFIHVPRTLAIMEDFAWTFSNYLMTSYWQSPKAVKFNPVFLASRKFGAIDAIKLKSPRLKTNRINIDVKVQIATNYDQVNL